MKKYKDVWNLSGFNKTTENLEQDIYIENISDEYIEKIMKFQYSGGGYDVSLEQLKEFSKYIPDIDINFDLDWQVEKTRLIISQ